jgi:hypothetical protein
VRGEQQGLLLLTAHRAKGLEFDHVAILNGGWDRPSRGEDPDAPRRLFYVAMTRAKSSLTILTDGPHAFIRPTEAILPRRVTPDTATLPRARLRYLPPDPKLVDLSYAGRLKAGHPALSAIASASPGDPVRLIRDGDRWRVENTQGQTLARLSRAFTPPEGATFLRGLSARRGLGHPQMAQGGRRRRFPTPPPPRRMGSCPARTGVRGGRLNGLSVYILSGDSECCGYTAPAGRSTSSRSAWAWVS